jgi:nucleotide-binding universal stress UspA family protein
VFLSSGAPVVALGPLADNPQWSRPPRSWPEPLSVPRLVALVSGTPTSEQVLPVAAAWAAALDMSLTIATVIEDAPASLSASPPELDTAAFVDQLVAETRKAFPGLVVDGAVLRDPIGPASGIKTYLEQEPAGLVALTTHARTGLRRAVLGSVAADIVNGAPVPALVVPVES